MNNCPDYKVKITPGFFDRILKPRPIDHNFKLTFFQTAKSWFGPDFEWTLDFIRVKYQVKNNILKLQPCYFESSFSGVIDRAELRINDKLEIVFSFSDKIKLFQGESLMMDGLNIKLK